MDFSQVKVLCIGDVMLDRFLYGDIERISPEAPVPVVRHRRVHEMLGGAGNVANNVVALGGRVTLVGLIGRDAAGEQIEAILGSLPGARSRLFASPTRQTTCKTRIIAANQQVVRLDDESPAGLSDDEGEGLLATALDCLGDVDTVVLSDYAKGVLSPALIARVNAAARAAGVPVFVDPKADDFSRYRGASCIKPNLKELAQAARCPVGDEGEMIAAARRLLAEAGADSMLVTRSAQGMTLITADGAHTVPARAREVFDVSGAGDTVIATLALASAAGRSLAQATHIANAAASVVVSKLGTATASIAEVLAELATDQPTASATPEVPGLRTLREARDLVERWRQGGAAIGFTNGCFDLLHAGHVLSLSHARAACDRLVVALNSDASASRLKGPTRPINTLERRAQVIAALRDVDCVVSFEEDTPIEAIRALMPDVLIKGADYANSEVVGASLVRATGGRVVLTPMVDGLSTTGLVSQMQSAPARRDEVVAAGSAQE